MTILKLAEEMNARVEGGDAEFSRLSTDTRSLEEGDAYLALEGERFDGHDFVKAAEEAGAGAVIVSRKVKSGLPQLLVPDTYKALGDIARLNRMRSKAKVIALTGSQGKTTVKEMIAAILGNKASTLATRANLNNTIGVPLTLLELASDHEFAVIEMGANSAGEIAFSSQVTRPDIALITCASAAHVEGFGSLQGIVEAKGEILDSLTMEGIAVLNGDDPNVGQWIARSAHCRQILFSANGNKAMTYRAEDISLNDKGQVSFRLLGPRGEVIITLQLLGVHNVANALAAAAVALEAGATLEDVRTGLAALKPVPGRLVSMQGLGNSLLIDDTYNASPNSFFAAIDVLKWLPGRQVLVAGDMKELGDEAEASHFAVGEYARKAGIPELWVTGEFAEKVAAGFGSGAKIFPDQESIKNYCIEQADSDLIFLIKGSRGAHMEVVLNELKLKGEA
ncbi:MAG: UDP-N-acetylmuramoyl-tripeptide--D-alanyl-D-alanine ligase [Proteobacteria bacterium]|nr:UDP-N-acetylmuramoyl-tripeptide--D-alanyl-D-alanine ligase [Pseudomonadota bacterium]MDA0926876.1 UDP-N-acetylmuramoyl-tripeptide--D-alanyl-D-alanine ligase [Pseudomonadota bacterium]